MSDKPAPPPTTRVYLYDADGHDRQVELGDRVLDALGERQLLWLDVITSEPEQAVALASKTGLPAKAARLLLDNKGPFRLVQFEGWMHITLVALHFSAENDWKPVRTAVLWDRRIVLTVHPGEVDAFQGFVAHARGETHMGALSADVFLSALLDWHLASYFKAVELLERDIDRFDDHVLTHDPQQQLVDELIRIRRRVSRLRRMLLPQREVFHGLTRPGVTQEVGEEAARQFDSIGSRFERAREALEHVGELVQGSFALHASRAADSANTFLKFLTFVTVLLGAMAVIAGILGMNFQAHLFESGERGFWSVVVALAVLSLASVVVARWRRWI